MTAPHTLRSRPRFGSTLALVLLLVSACARTIASPPPANLRAVAVVPVDNRTGSDLFADAPPLSGLFPDTGQARRVTAPDLLEDALRLDLAERGFVVSFGDVAPSRGAIRTVADAARWAASARLDVPVLYVQLRTWDATAPSHVLYVDVALDATLVAPDGRVLWTSRVPATPVDGGGASSVSLAYPEVARRVARLTLGDLAPAPAAVR